MAGIADWVLSFLFCLSINHLIHVLQVVRRDGTNVLVRTVSDLK